MARRKDKETQLDKTRKRVTGARVRLGYTLLRPLMQHVRLIELVDLCDISVEMATVLVAEETGGDARPLPDWFLVEVVRDLPRLAQRVAVKA